MDAHISSETQISQKEPKETTKERGISLTIMGQRSIHNSTHKHQRSLNETLGFNHDDHFHRMCNETGIPEFLEFQIPGIPMVVMVTSGAHSLCNPTQQDFIQARILPNSRNSYGRDGDVRCALPVQSYPTRFYPSAHPTHIYVSHVIQILKNPPEYTM